MKNVLFAFFTFCTLSLFAQGWVHTYPVGSSYDGATSVKQTSDGGYILTGHFTNELSNPQIFLLKLDADGGEEWMQVFAIGIYEEGSSVIQTTDGGFALTGVITTQPEINVESDQLVLIKTNSLGEEEWIEFYGSQSRGVSLMQTVDGGFVIAGATNSGAPTFQDAWVIKTDAQGVEEWSQTFGGTEIDRANSVKQTIDGGYVFAGESRSFGNGEFDAWLVKLNAKGEEEWSKTFGTNGVEQAFEVVQTLDGEYVFSMGVSDSISSASNHLLIKTNAEGEEMWQSPYLLENIADNDVHPSVVQTVDGGYALNGQVEYMDYYIPVLIKTDEEGLEEWQVEFESDPAMATCLQQTTDGGYVLAGAAYDGVEYFDIWVAKTNSVGEVTTIDTILFPDANRKIHRLVDVLGREAVPTPNIPFIEIYDDGTAEKRMIIE